jgi:hypothetical protein
MSSGSNDRMVMNNIGAASMCERELAKQEDIEQSRDE